MIVITAKFHVRPESVASWPAITESFTSGTRAEPGCLWFEWSHSLDDPQLFVLIEAFADDAAGAAHVASEHFRAAQRTLPAHLTRTPDVIHFNDPGIAGWAELGELAVSN